MATVVSTFQRAIYQKAYYFDPVAGKQKLVLVDAGYALYFRNLAIGFRGLRLECCWSRGTVFNRLQADFAEEL